LRPEQLTKNITTIYRLAARVYLCSLVPGFDRSQQSILNLIDAVATALQFVPGGPEGYDRSLVWPILMVGAYSCSGGIFRSTLNERVMAMGDYADFGSFGRMYRLLEEVWRLTDDPISPTGSNGGDLLSPLSDSGMKDKSWYSPLSTPGMRELKKRDVHWRDVMVRNGWHYLLI